MRTRIIPLRSVLVMLVVSCASAASGQVTALKIVSHRPPPDVLPGYVANDFFIDFTGQYTGSQLIVNLDSGSIFNAAPPAGNTPPSEALIGVPAFANIEWDTFVANGGPTLEDTVGNFGLGGAAIGVDRNNPGRGAQFDDEGIDQAWNPASGNEILDQEDFLVARVTLSDDAVGEVLYVAAANQIKGVPLAVVEGLATGTFEGEFIHGGGGERFIRVPIFNGVIGAIPEPSTVILLAFGIVSFAVLTRRRGSYSLAPENPEEEANGRTDNLAAGLFAKSSR